MTKKVMGALLFHLAINASAQQMNSTSSSAKQKKQNIIVQVPLTADNWDFKPNTVTFLTYKSVPAMKLLSSNGEVILKNTDFTDGIIEYDMEPVDPHFTGVHFRRNSGEENEYFYFRTANAGKANAIDAIQYAPFINGVNLWDMLFHFQGNASFEREKWNHVKLVIAGKQMRAYVNNISRPALEIPRLESNSTHGNISFDGQVIISNLVIKPNVTEGLSPLEGIDPTDNDPRYLRKWLVNKPTVTPENIDFSYASLPSKETVWDTIQAERRGLINLTRMFGQSKVRRLVWLKTNIHTASAQVRKLNLGFSDEVWVFINGKLLYLDKNTFNAPMMKYPDGRCTIENSSFNLPLNQGDNELLIGVSNNFYGWGIIAQPDKNKDVEIDK